MNAIFNKGQGHKVFDPSVTYKDFISTVYTISIFYGLKVMTLI